MFISPYRWPSRLSHDGYDMRFKPMLKRLSNTVRYALSAVFHGIIAALYLAILLLTALFNREEDDPVRCHLCDRNLGGKRGNDTRIHYCAPCFMAAMQANTDPKRQHLERCLSLPEAADEI